MTNLSSVSFAVHSQLKQKSVLLSRSQCLEAIAALLGYESLAALQAEDADPTINYYLEDAEFIILNPESGIKRLSALLQDKFNEELAFSVMEITAKAVTELYEKYRVFTSVENFYDDYAQEAIREAIDRSDEWGSATAGLNADFDEYPEMDDNFQVSGNLWKARDEWSLEVNGSAEGSYAGSDYFYNGSKIKCWGKLMFIKAGRAGLIYISEECSAAADDEDWSDSDDFMDFKGFSS